jgi:hypothetical protein
MVELFDPDGNRHRQHDPLRKFALGWQVLVDLLKGTWFWVVLALLMAVGTLFMTIRIGRVTGEQVGVELNRLDGSMLVIQKQGMHIYNGFTKDFYVLDLTLQTLEMTEVTSRGDREGKDDLMFKTVDGSDVNVDLKVQYRIDLTKSDVVLRTSGQGEAYKQKWVRDYIRSTVRNSLGELTTEEVYDTLKRDSKILAAKIMTRQKLEPFGIVIDAIVIPRKPHFYAEYEEMIRKKKLADQAVQEEQSKAMAARQRQLREIVEETNIVNVAVERFSGEMKEMIIQAEAEDERARREAEAYYERITVGAEAQLYQRNKEAEGILAKKKAEAIGLEAMQKALEGEGGRNMVKMEYARKLKDVTINGTPITIRAQVERYEHSNVAGTEGGRKQRSKP